MLMTESELIAFNCPYRNKRDGTCMNPKHGMQCIPMLACKVEYEYKNCLKKSAGSSNGIRK